MPLGEREGDTSNTRFFGIETDFCKYMKPLLDLNIQIGGGADFIVAPLMSPRYRPSLVKQSESFSLEPPLPFSKSDMNPLPQTWSSDVIGKISEWIDLDSPDPIIRKDSETAFKQEIAWASYLDLRACLLPTPKGNTWTNYARCVNQITHDHLKEMQLWLRIPLGKPDDGSIKSFKTPVDYWETWNSFRLLCDHTSKLSVALDNLSTLHALSFARSWYGEPVSVFIIHTDSFFTTDDNHLKDLPRDLKMLIAYFLNHSTQIIISEEQLNPRKVEEYRFHANFGGDLQIHRLLRYINCVRFLYTQMRPLSKQECSQFNFRDVLQPTIQPFKDKLDSQFYVKSEEDKKKHMEYKRAICQALLDRVPDEKKSVITIVLVVVGAGRGPLVRASLEAAKKTGRKLKVYAVDKNLNALTYLHKQCKLNKGWNDIVTIVNTDVRYWNAPETADILVSELLGSFGDNQLAPECLDGAQRFLKEDGISIPSSYTSFLQPVKASKLHSKLQEENNILRFETAYIVKMHNFVCLAPSQPLFTFSHPKCPVVKESNQRYKNLQFVVHDGPESTVVHGFAGYFDATLYKDVHLVTALSKAKTDLFSWEPIYFPLRTPICVHRGSILEVHFWRNCDSTKVWYEWCVTSPTTSPIYNCNARADCMWL